MPGLTSEQDSADRLRHMREIATRVSHFLAPSQTLRSHFLAFGIESHRITYQEQGINQSGLATVSRTSSTQLRIAFMGSFLASKAPHLLLEAFAGLPPGAASLRMLGAYTPYHGDDQYRHVLERALARASVEHGPVAHEEIPRVLAATDVLVVPSVWIENAPFVIREAFAAGVPVVASNIGGMAEMVTDGVNGLLFEAGDSQDLRRCLRRLIDEPDLLPQLRSGLPRMKTIEEDAEWTRALYSRVRAGAI
jgi:glycosyltransferase involved in cell wall biosynthesis